MDNIFELQDEITGKIVTALTVKMSSEELDSIADKKTINPLAHDLVLKGRAHLKL
jgi:hypothetical protein